VGYNTGAESSAWHLRRGKQYILATIDRRWEKNMKSGKEARRLVRKTFKEARIAARTKYKAAVEEAKKAFSAEVSAARKAHSEALALARKR
jgi:hypothetical protein